MGSLISGIGSALGAGAASRKADAASSILSDRYDTTRGDFLPYIQAGQAALPQLNALMPGTLTQAQLEAMPGYQFIRDQGLKATQSAAAARGLGVSGAALKGAGTFATGLADQTYTNAFNQQQQQFQDKYNIANMGETAASGLGSIGANLGSNQANALMNAGIAQAQGTAAPFKGVGDTVNQAIGSLLNANPNLLNFSGSQSTGRPAGY